MKPARTRLVAPLLSGLLAVASGSRAELREPLTPAERTNGAQTLAPLRALQEDLGRRIGRIVDAQGRQVATAVWVSAAGHLLTKASEVPRIADCRVEWGDGRKAALREVRRDSARDLLLARAAGVTAVQAASFSPAQALSLGHWVSAPAQGRELRLGVISAQRRRIPGLGAAIGVRMDESLTGAGVRIAGVAEDSPAAAAGIRVDDVLTELAATQVQNYRQVSELISKRQPGEEIDVALRRAGKEVRLRVRLASKTKIMANWEGEDFANGGISIRTDNFAQVLQHDLPLAPADMGGPLIDLEGRAIGLNIARVDRVTTFALPTEAFWPEVQRWIQADLQPKPPAPVKADPPAAAPPAPPAAPRPAR